LFSWTSSSSSSVPVLTLPRRTCHHSASAFSLFTLVVAIRSVCVQKALIYQLTLLYWCMVHEYHVIYSVRYYPRLHLTAVDLGTYYPRTRERYWTPPTRMQAATASVYASSITTVFSLVFCDHRNADWQWT
jgi:hypothetical protein